MKDGGKGMYMYGINECVIAIMDVRMVNNIILGRLWRVKGENGDKMGTKWDKMGQNGTKW